METLGPDRGRLSRRRFALVRGAAPSGVLGALDTSPAGRTRPGDPAGEAAAATAPAATATTSTATTSTAPGGRFDLSVPVSQLVGERTAPHGTGMRSFAVDEAAGHLYVLQPVPGGVRLDDEPAPVSADDRAARGDLCLTRFDLTGAEPAHMYLRGFGRGTALGLEPTGDTVHLWTGADPDPATGRCRAVARFPFADGQVLVSASPSVALHWPVADSTDNQPSVDAGRGRLLLRHRADGAFRYRLMDLARVVAGDYTAITDVPQVGVAEDEEVRGFALFGDHAYQVTGPAGSAGVDDAVATGAGAAEAGGAAEPCATHLSCVDLRTGELAQRVRTEAGYSLSCREAAGMAVRLADPPRLCLGFASGPSGERKVSVYHTPR